MADADFSDDDELDIELPWMLGFAEEPLNAADLRRHRFPSKLGGKPAWLNPVQLPHPDQLKCPMTGKHLQFLLQVYAPTQAENAFHRTLFVFISPKGDSLTEPGAVRCFRCQMPRDNSFYAYEPAPKEQTEPLPLSPDDDATAAKLDGWRSGDVAEFNELELIVEPEEDKQEDEEDADDDDGVDGGRSSQEGPAGGAAAASAGAAAGSGAAQEGGPPGAAAGPPPSLDVDMDKVGLGSGDEKIESLISQYKEREKEEGALPQAEVEAGMEAVQEAMTPEKQQLVTFNQTIEKHPDQVIRYCFHKEGAPLCPGLSPAPSASDIPPCHRCGAPRIFEFQILPQILAFMDIDNEDPQAPDWGSIAVYSCSASCDPDSALTGSIVGSAHYPEEYCWVQAPLNE